MLVVLTSRRWSAGNLLRAGDVRGYNAMARMYTMEYATAVPPMR